MSDTELALIPLETSLGPMPPSTANPAIVYCARIATSSQRVMQSDLRDIAEYFSTEFAWDTFPWWKLRYEHTQLIRSKLQEKYPPVTANRHLSALRGVLKESRKLRQMTADECANACEVSNVKVDSGAEPAGRALEKWEVKKLIDACDLSSPRGARDACLLAMLFGAGLRRSEASAANVKRLGTDAKNVTVVGKGGKTRTTPMPKDAALLIQNWLMIRSRVEGPLLVSFTMNGDYKREGDQYARLSASGIYSVLEEIALRANIPDVRPHDARRTRITQMLSEGQSIAIIAKIVGHAEITTTAKYDRSQQEAMQKAAEEVSML